MAVVTTGVHYGRDEDVSLDIAPIDGGRWMVGVGSDCTIYGTAAQLRGLAGQILDQVSDPMGEVHSSTCDSGPHHPGPCGSTAREQALIAQVNGTSDSMAFGEQV